MKKFNVLLFIIIVTSGCVSTKTMIRQSKHEATNFSWENMNGTYKNENGLWAKLTRANKLNTFKKKTLPDSTFVELEMLSSERLQVKLKTHIQPIDSFVLKGNVKGDYFSVRRKLNLIPFFPLYYLREEYKLLLANNSKGNLIIVKGEVSEGILLVMGAGRKWNKSYEYIKL